MNDNLNFKAFDEGGMDEFLRKTVEGHRVEPKPGLWKGISRTLLWRELLRFNFSNLSVKSRVAGVAGLIILAAALYFIIPTTSSTTPVAVSTPAPTGSGNSTARPVVINASTPVANVTRPAGNIVPASAAVNSTPHAAQKTATAPEPARQPQMYANNATRVAADLKKSNRSSLPDISAAENTAPAIAGGQSITPHREGMSRVVPYEAELLQVSPQTDTIITIHTIYGTASYLKTKPDATQFFSLNFGVNPEVSFYSSPETYSKVNGWVNGMLTYHVSRYSVATGVGLGYVYDKSKYRVDYKSNDSIGYYTNVISYTVGTNNEIIYNTVSKSVYDSLLHQNDYRTINRYAYIQVPLLFGYRLYESGKVSLTFQAGPAVSFLVGTRKASAEIDYANARIIRVDDNTPARVHTNWQMWGDLLFEIRMNRKMSIYVEPTCKYFLNPVSEQENVSFKAPWTVGLGVGIQFNFAPKKKNP